METEITRLTLAEAAELVKQGKISPVELTRACLANIGKYNPVLNAFITVTAESALAEAAQAEREIRAGQWRGPLHGIPVAMKDLIDQKGVLTTAGSAVFKANVAKEDAEVTRRLRAAGAVLLGKTNLHEFAYGASGIISHFGVVRNPWNTERITGGSSSGSAAAVAVGMCFAALGTDTAGSIRLPAAFCGIVGLKPSFGLVSRRGIFPLSLSLDHAGPMTRSVDDAAIVLDAIAGYDPADDGSREFSTPSRATPARAGDPAFPRTSYRDAVRRNTTDLRIGIATAYFCEGADPKIESELRIGVARITAPRTSAVRDVKVPIDEDRTVHLYEAYHYHQPFLAAHSGDYDPQTLQRILAGKDISDADYQAKKGGVAGPAQPDGRAVSRGGRADYPHLPRAAAEDRRPAGGLAEPAQARTGHPALHAALQCAGTSDHYRALRLHCRRHADRHADQRRCGRRGQGDRGREPVRTAHGMAPPPAADPGVAFSC
jgi:aspartyl-tRNA(Asn)/glutamyl-tRNA(Gln) amidotransferase subunit A